MNTVRETKPNYKIHCDPKVDRCLSHITGTTTKLFANHSHCPKLASKVIEVTNWCKIFTLFFQQYGPIILKITTKSYISSQLKSVTNRKQENLSKSNNVNVFETLAHFNMDVFCGQQCFSELQFGLQ